MTFWVLWYDIIAVVHVGLTPGTQILTFLFTRHYYFSVPLSIMIHKIMNTHTLNFLLILIFYFFWKSVTIKVVNIIHIDFSDYRVCNGDIKEPRPLSSSSDDCVKVDVRRLATLQQESCV